MAHFLKDRSSGDREAEKCQEHERQAYQVEPTSAKKIKSEKNEKLQLQV